MKSIKVINVGQGDSFILSPQPHCELCSHDIFIDLGTETRDVFREKTPDKKVIVSLSHSHSDHIGGLIYLARHYDEVDEIWLPYYFDEIMAFWDFLLKLKGIEKVPLNSGALLKVKASVNTARLLENISNAAGKTIRGLYNMKLCEHISVLNPQLSVERSLNISKKKLEEYRQELASTNYAGLRNLIPDDKFNTFRNSLFTEGWSYSTPKLIPERNFEDSMRMTHGLLYKHRGLLNNFVSRPTQGAFNRLFNAAEKNINNLSTIIHYRTDDVNVLFAGDVCSGVLNKLKKDNSLPKADILKIPHHGSKYGITKELLEHIKPETAIVSHNNGLFGRQKDPHPNQEVIDYLDALKIDTLYTNDVIKHGAAIKHKPPAGSYNAQIEFID